MGNESDTVEKNLTKVKCSKKTLFITLPHYFKLFAFNRFIILSFSQETWEWLRNYLNRYFILRIFLLLYLINDINENLRQMKTQFFKFRKMEFFRIMAFTTSPHQFMTEMNLCLLELHCLSVFPLAPEFNNIIVASHYDIKVTFKWNN